VGALTPYASYMHTIELTDEEYRMVVAAVRSYLNDFGHEEADLLHKIKELLQKLETTQPPGTSGH
jgi:hypothetical protein